MSEPYCGIKKIPKNRRRGTMNECLQKSQVRYYGIQKVDSKLVNKISKPKSNVQKSKLRGEIIKLDVIIKKLKDKFVKEKDIDKKKAIMIECNKLVDKMNRKNATFRQLEKRLEKKN